MASAAPPSPILLLEHVNLNVQEWTPENEKFYFGALGCARDTRAEGIASNIQKTGGSMRGLVWANIGLQQFHMPIGEPEESTQRIRGTIALAFPDLDAVRGRLRENGFAFEEDPDGGGQGARHGPALALQTPTGQALRLHGCDNGSAGPFAPPGAADAGLLTLPGGHSLGVGMPYMELLCAPGAAAGISRFYAQTLGVPALLEAGRCTVPIGNQAIFFREVEREEDLPAYDGHHIAIYIGKPETGDVAASFTEMYKRCQAAGLVYNNPRFPNFVYDTLEDALRLGEFRVLDLVDPETGRVAYRLEHEIRSLDHPGFSCKALIRRSGEEDERR